MNSQGRFHVRRDDSGGLRIECPPVMVVPVEVAVEMARAILAQAGVDVVFADPGTTVIRPPTVVRPFKGNGHLS